MKDMLSQGTRCINIYKPLMITCVGEDRRDRGTRKEDRLIVRIYPIMHKSIQDSIKFLKVPNFEGYRCASAKWGTRLRMSLKASSSSIQITLLITDYLCIWHVLIEN